jgi:hypothetical protein
MKKKCKGKKIKMDPKKKPRAENRNNSIGTKKRSNPGDKMERQAYR